MTTAEEHEKYRIEARERYLNDRDASSDALDWRLALWNARREIIGFLRESDFLCDVAGALEKSGRHSRSMRHFLAPPVSQDQFKLICPSWPKSSEKSGTSVAQVRAQATEAVFLE